MYGRCHQSLALGPASAVVSSMSGALHTIITIHSCSLVPLEMVEMRRKGHSQGHAQVRKWSWSMEAGCGMAEESLLELTPQIQF